MPADDLTRGEEPVDDHRMDPDDLVFEELETRIVPGVHGGCATSCSCDCTSCSCIAWNA